MSPSAPSGVFINLSGRSNWTGQFVGEQSVITAYSCADLLSTVELNYEEWRALLRPDWGLYTPNDPKTFSGRVRSRNIYGFVAADIGGYIPRCERGKREIRLDGIDHWYALFQVSGRSKVIQNHQSVTLSVGDVTIIDSARPVTYINDGGAQWLSLQLPRQRLISHLGFEPQGGSGSRSSSRVGRVLYQLLRDTSEDDPRASSYLQLAVYDLIGALFAPPDPAPVSLHANRLFKRICAIIRNRFADPGLGPAQVAAEAGVSLRYVQKVFWSQRWTCGQFIESIRLDHASRLLQSRALLSAHQPLSEIAYASGFGDYNNFSRRFRRRFGQSPGAYAAGAWPNAGPTDGPAIEGGEHSESSTITSAATDP